MSEGVGGNVMRWNEPSSPVPGHRTLRERSSAYGTSFQLVLTIEEPARMSLVSRPRHHFHPLSHFSWVEGCGSRKQPLYEPKLPRPLGLGFHSVVLSLLSRLLLLTRGEKEMKGK